MRRKWVLILSALLAAILLTSTALADSARLSYVAFDLGYLVADGALSGLGNTDVTVLLDASGFPVITCTNQGGSQAPGNQPTAISVTEAQSIPGAGLVEKNGKAGFRVEINDLPALDAVEAGCPNENWSAQIDFIYWEGATIRVRDTATQEVLLRQDYTCTTTRDYVGCVAVR